MEILKDSGEVKANPGGMVVVEGHVMSKVDGECGEGDGMVVSGDKGAKEISLEKRGRSEWEMYVERSGWTRA